MLNSVAQLSWAWKKFYNLGARSLFIFYCTRVLVLKKGKFNCQIGDLPGEFKPSELDLST